MQKAAFLVHFIPPPRLVRALPLKRLAGLHDRLPHLWRRGGGVRHQHADPVHPLNFYCIIAVLFAFVSAVFSLDFGPMKKAERVNRTGELDDPASAAHDAKESSAPVSGVKPRAKNMLIPMATMVGTILAVLCVTGGGNPTQGDGMQSLLWGCMVSVLVVSVMCMVEKLFTLDQLVSELIHGMSTMLPIACVLLFGLTMGSLVSGLDTGNYLSSIFLGVLTPPCCPC